MCVYAMWISEKEKGEKGERERERERERGREGGRVLFNATPCCDGGELWGSVLHRAWKKRRRRWRRWLWWYKPRKKKRELWICPYPSPCFAEGLHQAIILQFLWNKMILGWTGTDIEKKVLKQKCGPKSTNLQEENYHIYWFYSSISYEIHLKTTILWFVLISEKIIWFFFHFACHMIMPSLQSFDIYEIIFLLV